jgi:hypothetical protein
MYGFRPDQLLELLFSTNDEKSFAKAVMGLYLAFAILWSFGCFNTSYLKPALLSNALFMLGLAFGRLLAVFNDGWPSPAFVIGMVGEFTLGLYSAYLLNSQYGKDLK